MRSKMVVALLCALMVAGVFSCSRRTDDPEPQGNGKVKLEWINNVGASALNLNSQWYTNQNGDSFTVSKFNYYISNITLNGSGVSYTEPESYHLVQHSLASSTSFDLSDVPAGTYSGITFTIGVDSLRNVSGAQTGALDPANGMFWSWSTGYIMLKLEGVAPKSSATGGLITFHAGGFSGANSTVRTVTLNFPATMQVNAANINHLHLTADVLALFKSPNLIDFSVTNGIQTAGENAKKLADNYAGMFSVTYAGL